jgi:hypothetical protein
MEATQISRKRAKFFKKREKKNYWYSSRRETQNNLNFFLKMIPIRVIFAGNQSIERILAA